jgi:acetyltransferase-like isoleucine patch superfamily enzyme
LIKKLKNLLKVPADVYVMLITFLPGSVGFYLRFRYWRDRLRFIGEKVRIDTGVYFQNPDFIEISENCWIDKNVHILAGLDRSNREKIILANAEYKGPPGVVHIGKNVHLGVGCILSGISAGIFISDDCCLSAGCKLYAFSHHYLSPKDPSNQDVHFGSMASPNRQVIMEGAIVIGTNTGLALNCVVLPGTAISQNSFVSIGSVVHHGYYDKNSLIKGHPAEKIANRFKTGE